MRQAAGLTASMAVCVGAGAAIAIAPGLTFGALGVTAVGSGATWAVRRYATMPHTGLQWVVGLAAFLLPLTPWIGQHNHGGGQAIRLGLAALLWSLLLVGAATYQATQRRVFLVGGFVALQLVAYTVGVGGSYGSVRLLNWLMFLPLALVAYDSRTVRVAAAGVVASAAVLVGGVVLQYGGGLTGTWGGAQIDGGHATRYTSFLLNANDLGLFMLAIAIVCFVGCRNRLLGVLGAAAAGGIVVLTGSRGAFLALPFLAVYLLFARRVRMLVAVPALVAAVYVAAPIALPQSAVEIRAATGSVGSIISGSDQSLLIRERRWQQWINRNTNPVVGAGYGGYTTDRSFLTQQTNRQLIYRNLTVDNSWLKVYLEEGLIGVAILALIFLGAIRRTLVTPTRLSVILGALLVVVAFRSLSVDILDINPWNFYLWLLIGLAYGVEATADDGDSPAV